MERNEKVPFDVMQARRTERMAEQRGGDPMVEMAELAQRLAAYSRGASLADLTGR